MSIATLDALMTPLANCLDESSLRAVVALRADAGGDERIEWLASRAGDGFLSPEERGEYESSVAFATFLGVLQSKASKRLAAMK